ncbi:ubiquitin carboxyl-terminal hydrolase 37 isoform X1 [Octopus bimaculoides]|uniref:Ubiquitin carboxyl-terminal hydrolase n=1 Tax=Octopus bimaculoides TaxID=37653 RepID=A0A0L8HDH9_OCTBM|nr:ubiquitin carboxyl-terminal hydrolase 37 isoform X1 [Octopus bimaculoides]|eukprot:XP_014773196.1 PREDICTED: ubiquitin carboxyl-terminal hydrolase 37-like isoform X1 [Octopus bimaculoides]
MQNILSLGKNNFYSKNKSSCGASVKQMLGMKRCETRPVKRARFLVDSSTNSQPQKVESPPVPAIYPLPKLALRGLTNMGNTCYLNAILQSLFSLETFATELLLINCKVSKVNPSSLHSTMANLLISQTKSESDVSKVTLLGNVREAISTVGTHFLSNDMQDAHECLNQVLDCLKEEGVKLAASIPTFNNSSSDDDPNCRDAFINPTVQNFEFDINRSITCKRCGVVVSKVEQCIDLSLDIPKGCNPSIQDALDLFFVKENVEYRCAKCNHDKSEVSKCISRLPRVLILHLKRYTYSVTASCNRKVIQHISIPKYLTLSSHCSETIIPAPSINSLFTSSPVARTEMEKDSSLCRRLEYTDSVSSLFESAENSDDLGVVPISTLAQEFSNNIHENPSNHTDNKESTKSQDLSFFNDLEFGQNSKLLAVYCSTPKDNSSETKPMENGVKYLSNDDLFSLSEEERMKLAIENSLQLKTETEDHNSSAMQWQPEQQQSMFNAEFVNRENSLLPENENNSLTCYDVENKENQQPTQNGKTKPSLIPVLVNNPHENGEVNGKTNSNNIPVVDLEVGVNQEEEDLKKAKAMSLYDLNNDDELQPSPAEFGVSVETLKRSKEEIEILKTNSVEGNLPQSYQLVSVVAHIGNTSVSGHYLSEVLDLQTNKWYSFDDKEVQLTNETEVQNTRQDSGYIFFYLSKEIANSLRSLSSNKDSFVNGN